MMTVPYLIFAVAVMGAVAGKSRAVGSKHRIHSNGERGG